MTTTNDTWRRSKYYNFDPLAQEISPALLNSVDIKRYIDLGCLIENSTFDEDCLKIASYEMKFLGDLYDWTVTDEGQLRPRCRRIQDDESMTLYRNSISYLWMEEKLLLPEYIAGRFNLHIRHVHKGLLLGTGPLVDPGFSGSLLIPLHNLTNNDYEVTGGDGIIWVEFTKLSSNDYWTTDDKDGQERPKHLKMFPPLKDLEDPELYFSKSHVAASGGVQSAFQGALDQTRKAADAARESAKNAREYTDSFKKFSTWAGIATVILVVVGVGALIMQGYSLVSQITATTNEIQRQVESVRSERATNADAVREEITSINERISDNSSEVENVRDKVEQLYRERDTTHNGEQ